MLRKVKVVNINQTPAAKPLGVNPMDPWQAKSGIAEASEEELLHRFLNSRGINPKFVSTETKIAHSKSGEFLKWRRDHEFTEELTKENHIAIAMGNMLDDEGSMVLGQLEQMERAINMVRSHIGKDYEKQLPSWVQAKVTLATDYIDTVGNYITSKNEKVNEEVKKPKPTSLDRFRKASDEREKKHDDLAKNSGGMTSAIDRLQKHLNKEGVELDEEELDQMINEVLGKDASAGDWIHDFIHSDNPKFAGKSKKERQKMALGAYYGKQNEEFEQLDELKKSTVFSWLKQQPVVPEKKPGMDKKAHNKRIKTHSKSWNRALDRLSGYKPTSENTLDSLAATQAPCDGANGGETTSIKSQRSKSARMIKALYKRKGMVKEDTYDHEKEDKSVQTYGKKPKFNQTDKKDSFGEKKPEALAVMTGGTTLTGEKRDEVEIDPMMKNRPGQNQFNKEFGKKGN